jgi:CBS domain containing-hemolysin-like protein
MIQNIESLSTVAHVIQLAVAPVFLLTGIGAILSVLAMRLGRIVDRFRILNESHDHHHAHVLAEMKILSDRSDWVHWAITLCTVSALLVALVIATLFVGTGVKFDTAHWVSPMFVLAMIALIIGLICFLREIYLSTHTIELPPELSL